MIGVGLSPVAVAVRQATLSLSTLNPLTWYDGTTAASLWQDTAATVSAATSGNPVRRIDPKIGTVPLLIRTSTSPATRGAGVSFGGNGIDMAAMLPVPASHAVMMAVRVTSWTYAHADLFCLHGTNGYGLRAGSASQFLALLNSSNLGLAEFGSSVNRAGLHLFSAIFDATTGATSLRVDGTAVALASGYNGALDARPTLKIFGSRYDSANVLGEFFGLAVLSSADPIKVGAAENRLKALLPAV